MAVSSPTANLGVTNTTPPGSYTDFSNIITAQGKDSEQHSKLQASVRKTNSEKTAEKIMTQTQTDGNAVATSMMAGLSGQSKKHAQELSQTMKS